MFVGGHWDTPGFWGAGTGGVPGCWGGTGTPWVLGGALGHPWVLEGEQWDTPGCWGRHPWVFGRGGQHCDTPGAGGPLIRPPHASAAPPGAGDPPGLEPLAGEDPDTESPIYFRYGDTGDTPGGGMGMAGVTGDGDTPRMETWGDTGGRPWVGDTLGWGHPHDGDTGGHWGTPPGRGYWRTPVTPWGHPRW